MRSVTVIQLGARMHYAVPVIFQQANQLNRLYTDLYCKRYCALMSSSLAKVFPGRGINKLLTRKNIEIPDNKIIHYPLLGISYVLKLLRVNNEIEAIKVFADMSYKMQSRICKTDIKSDIVYSYNTVSHLIFSDNNHKNRYKILEQTIAPKTIEVDILSEVSDYYRHLKNDYILKKYIEKEYNEWEMANHIVCASDFVKKGLIQCGVSENKISVVPYGVKLPSSEMNIKVQSSDLITVLYVGSVSNRKGFHTLLEAAALLVNEQVIFKVIGPISPEYEYLRHKQFSNIQIIGSIPRSEVNREMVSADIFCLPSLCEGSATVVYEALACSLPVITTENSGTIVRNNVDGFIIPVNSVDYLVSSILKLANDSTLRSQMSMNARERSEYGSLEAYGSRLMEIVNRID